MDLRPIVTNFGEESLYLDLSKDIERRLPQKSVHWNRTLGRESKTVKIKATFTKFNSDELGVTTDGTVTRQPFLHLYWTSCMENDEFRNGVKQKIMNWQENLKSRDITDWLIIQVVYQVKPNAAKSKISLPRSSVFDKIKNDLCGKDGSKLVQFWEPKKEDLFTKSRDSWTSLLSQLRKLLLDSISKYLMKFEKKVRMHREKYSDASWSFIEYLKLNEELATIFKSVTLHNDALVQYDEIDALFSQFSINGKVNERPPWMMNFTNSPSCWDGISLNKFAVKYFRDAVYGGRASLIDLRNYIFIRQWQMLFNTQRTWDAAPRLLAFLFTVVKEMKILQSGSSDCVSACWVVSCCLEYMQAVETKAFSTKGVMTALAQVSDYAREKLFLLGRECQLLPGQEPAQELITEITSGMCRSQPVKEESGIGSRVLLKALSSAKDFDKLYLRVCGKTMSLFNSVGRVRFASRIGIDMARYYMTKFDFEKAELQLSAALSHFSQSNWTSLYIDVLEPLAVCQAELKSFDNYLPSLAALSCAETLSPGKRLLYAEKFLHCVRHEVTNVCTSSMDPILTLEEVKIDLIKEIGHIGETINVILTLRNNLFREIQFDEIEVRMRYTETDKVRLSSVDGGINYMHRGSDRAEWSELFDQREEPLSPSTQKTSILQRIKSRRIVKQRETESKDSVDGKSMSATPDNGIENSSAFATQFFSNDLPLPTEGPKTLAEIASGLSRAFSIEEESEASRTENITAPIFIPNGSIQGRCDSTASSLSVVSISSNSEASSMTDKGISVQKGIGQKVISSLALNENSNIDILSESDSVDEAPSNLISDPEENESQLAVYNECPQPDAESNLDNSYEHRSGLNFDIASADIENEEREEDELDNGAVDDDDVFGGERLNAKFDIGSDRLDDDTDDIPGTGEASVLRSQNEAVNDCTENPGDQGFEIEEEVEIMPTKSLLSGPTLLMPGKNNVTVKAKVLHTGRYNFQTLLCQIHNVFLYKLLELPRQSRAFFVISDPPKFALASNYSGDCLLLGKKQRIHVTLSNGPGYIHELSVIQISSSTGLQFSPVPPSSVMVYSTNQKEEPREGAMHIELDGSNNTKAYMYLPKCGPYEKAEIYFDAYAPVENMDLFDCTTKHEVSLSCLWLSEYIPAQSQLEFMFYEPFALESEILSSTQGHYLRTSLISKNPVQISITKPVLECMNSDNFSFSCLTSDIQMTMQEADEDLSLIWHVQEIDNEKQNPQILICRLKVNFKSEDEGDTGEFFRQFEVTNINQPIITVTTAILESEAPIYKGSSYEFDVIVKEAGQLPGSFENGWIVCTLVDDDQWKYDDDVKNRQQQIRLSDDGFHFNFKTKAIPCVSGLLRHPQLVFSKALEVSAEDSENGPIQPRAHHVASRLPKTRLSSSRRTSAGTTTEIAQPFSPAEAIFSCAGQLIRVLQPNKQVSVL